MPDEREDASSESNDARLDELRRQSGDVIRESQRGREDAREEIRRSAESRGRTDELLSTWRLAQGRRRRYHVVPRSDGAWEVSRDRNAGTRARIYSTQRDAQHAATELAQNSGGGEIIIHARDGRIRQANVIAGRDPNPPREPS